jgi:hypothetical protein
MKKFLVLLILPVMTGCAGMPEWFHMSDRHGYTRYDPCIRCGEKWDQIPNQPFEAQHRAARGEKW